MMEPTEGSVQSPVWPLPKFYFRVQYDGMAMEFQEVSGLDAETQVIEYRAGHSPAFSAVKMPGLKKFSDVTMKKGVFQDSQKFWDFFQQVKMGTYRKAELDIELLDENGAVAFRWKLSNAFPTKITATDLKNESSSAVETIVFAHEGITMEAK
jgi:phage tail-like protein